MPLSQPLGVFRRIFFSPTWRFGFGAEVHDPPVAARNPVTPRATTRRTKEMQPWASMTVQRREIGLRLPYFSHSGSAHHPALGRPLLHSGTDFRRQARFSRKKKRKEHSCYL